MNNEPGYENISGNQELPKSTEGLKDLDLLRFEVDPKLSNKDLFNLVRPEGSKFYTVVDHGDIAAFKLLERTPMSEELARGNRVVEADLDAAHQFITNGDLDALKRYYESWKEVKDRADVTEQKVVDHSGYELSDWYTEVIPGYFEYFVFAGEEGLQELSERCLGETLRQWFIEIFSNDVHHYKSFYLPGGMEVLIKDTYGGVLFKDIDGSEFIEESAEVLEDLVRTEFELKSIEDVSKGSSWSDFLGF